MSTIVLFSFYTAIRISTTQNLESEKVSQSKDVSYWLQRLDEASVKSSVSAVSSFFLMFSSSTFAWTTAQPMLSPNTFIAVLKNKDMKLIELWKSFHLNRSKSQSITRISETRSAGKPIAVITMSSVTRPASGIPAAPTLATVDVILKFLIKLVRFWHFTWLEHNLQNSNSILHIVPEI